MKLRIFVIFHKTLYEDFYEMPSTMLKDYITFVAVNDKKEKIVPAFATYNTILESQLCDSWTNKLQEFQYHESSVLIHLGKSRLLDSSHYTGCLHYDMKITQNTLMMIQNSINDLGSNGILFYFKTHRLDENVANSFGGGSNGFDTWQNIIDLYNNTFNTSHLLEQIIHREIPMYHSWILPSKVLRPLAAFVERVAPMILKFLGSVRHLPYHLDRLWGIILLLKKLDGEIPIWLPILDIMHSEERKEPKFHEMLSLS